jgi:RluA family pseudouridine synthase
MNPVIKLSSPETSEFWEIPVLFEDDALLVVDKPSRLLSSPDRYDPARPNLMRLLHQGIERGSPWAISRNLTYLMNVHRLDFETSGIMVLTKSKPVLTLLADQFGTAKPIKGYAAIVHGGPEEDQFEIDASLAPHPRNPAVMRVDPKSGKKSRTAFSVLKRFRGYALLECRPLTGRTHQIRVHAQYAGFPLVGDRTYGGSPLLLSDIKRAYKPKANQPEKPLMGRVALHAERLEFAHPVSGDLVKIQSPRPRDFQVSLKYLAQFSGL